jgi:hypothetical protein
MHALSSSNQEAISSAPNEAPENTESDTVLSSPRNSKCHPESSIKFSLENGGAGDLSDCASPEDEDEDVCPTCLEGNHFFGSFTLIWHGKYVRISGHFVQLVHKIAVHLVKRIET